MTPLKAWSSHAGEMANTDTENTDFRGIKDLLSQAVHVPNRPVDSHRKVGSVRPASYDPLQSVQ